MKELNTVNVIEMDGDTVLGLASYQDNEEGNRLAEIRFHDLAMANIKNLVEEDVESYIEDGMAESGTYKLLLVHSTEGEKADLIEFVHHRVDVTRKADDQFNNDFTGTAIGIRHGMLQVRDADDDVWEVEADQCAIAL